MRSIIIVVIIENLFGVVFCFGAVSFGARCIAPKTMRGEHVRGQTITQAHGTRKAVQIKIK